MTKLFLGASFLASLVFLPAVSVLVGILYIGAGGSPWLLIFGGVFLDVVFGAPVASLSGFAYVYTVLCILTALSAWFLRGALFE